MDVDRTELMKIWYSWFEARKFIFFILAVVTVLVKTGS